MCVNFENTRALNSPVFLSIVKKSLDYSSQFVTFIMICLTVQTVKCLHRRNKYCHSLIRTVKLLV